MRKIITTLWPDTPIEVEEAEYLDLSRQGLIAEDKTPKKDLPKEENRGA